MLVTVNATGTPGGRLSSSDGDSARPGLDLLRPGDGAEDAVNLSSRSNSDKDIGLLDLVSEDAKADASNGDEVEGLYGDIARSDAD